MLLLVNLILLVTASLRLIRNHFLDLISLTLAVLSLVLHHVASLVVLLSHLLDLLVVV